MNHSSYNFPVPGGTEDSVMSSGSTSDGGHSWTFLSNHAHVLVCLARDPDTRLRDVAREVGLTQRRVSKIVADLEACGVIEKAKEGRRNHYEIDGGVALRHPLESNRTVGMLLAMLLERGEAERLGLGSHRRSAS